MSKGILPLERIMRAQRALDAAPQVSSEEFVERLEGRLRGFTWIKENGEREELPGPEVIMFVRKPE